MTPAQLAALKADIAANTAVLNGTPINALPNTSDANFEIAAWYSALATPDFWVWRTDVSRSDVYNSVSPDGTNWNWTTYKNQGATEQNAWVQMFMGDQADFSKPNLRAGIAAIFTGSAPATAQRDHCLSVGRRKALRVEKLLAAGAGSATSPAAMGREGPVSGNEIEAARNLP